MGFSRQNYWGGLPCPLQGIFPTKGLNPHLSFFFFEINPYFILFYFIFYFIFLFVVNFVIHWNETAMGLHVFPIPIPPPTSHSTRSP